MESASAERMQLEAPARSDMNRVWQALGGLLSELQP